MRDLVSPLRQWIAEGRPFALATVVETAGSTPRPPGTAMAVAAGPTIVGDVSGGCVESAVVEICLDVLESGDSRMARFGVSDQQAFEVGLTCGGELEVFVRRIDSGAGSVLDVALSAIEVDQAAALAFALTEGTSGPPSLVILPESTVGTLGNEGIDIAVRDDAQGMLQQGTTGVRRYGSRGERRQDELGVFVSSFVPAPHMMVFGAIDFAAAVVGVGKYLGYRVTVCDARPLFATRERFREADEVVVDWPHRYLASADVDPRTVICVLTHDPKFDVPLLEVALRTPAAYVGVMGSRTTHEDRLERLRAAGLTESELERLRAPIGLDIGARTPEEVAIAIAAEIVADRWGGSGLPLRVTSGRVHDSARDRLTPLP